MKTYSELSEIDSFLLRYEYLRVGSTVGIETFGSGRWLNQAFYTSREWRAVRSEVIARDMACDLGVDGNEIYRDLYIHHMNPITAKDLIDHNEAILNPEYLITVSLITHNAIHYGTAASLALPAVQRRAGDTKLW